MENDRRVDSVLNIHAGKKGSVFYSITAPQEMLG